MLNIIKFSILIGLIGALLVTASIALPRLSNEPELGWIVYTAKSRTGITQVHATRIYATWLDGEHTTELNTFFTDVASPVWQPDGNQIAFLAAGDTRIPKEGGNFYYTGLYVMRFDGSNLRMLARLDDIAATPNQVVWSRDAQRLIFRVGRSLTDIYRVHVDGSHLQKLISEGVATPYWESMDDPEHHILITEDNGDYDQWISTNNQFMSPDRQRRLYLRFDEDNGVYFVNKDAPDEPVLLFNAPAQFLTFPFWSPDGEDVWFSTPREYTTGTNIYRFHEDTQQLDLVVSSTYSVNPLGWIDDRNLIISVDQFDVGRPDLYLLSANTTETKSHTDLQRITFDGDEKRYSDWRPHPKKALSWGILGMVITSGLLFVIGIEYVQQKEAHLV